MASCLIELGEGEIALETARKALMFLKQAMITVVRLLLSFEFGKAQILLEKYDDGLATLENVLGDSQ